MAESYISFVKGLPCVNDCSERNVRLVQDYIDGYHSEDMRQNLFQVVRDNRTKLTHNLTMDELTKTKY